jgi:hypothetical protein
MPEEGMHRACQRLCVRASDASVQESQRLKADAATRLGGDAAQRVRRRALWNRDLPRRSGPASHTVSFAQDYWMDGSH